jgi:hypothetical protein
VKAADHAASLNMSHVARNSGDVNGHGCCVSTKSCAGDGQVSATSERADLRLDGGDARWDLRIERITCGRAVHTSAATGRIR